MKCECQYIKVMFLGTLPFIKPTTSSTMLINYTAAGALTCLHITENRADVRIS
ncbi:MAG: hypothetical protein KKD69_01300 [Euryarchaeota archaeon]|nr:hypothetical protein [Euryarchaeota archaeon]